MPKATTPTYPLSALFAINKPSGLVSMSLLNSLQPLFASSKLFKDPTKAVAGTDSGAGKGGGGKGNRKRKWKEERVKLGQGGTLDPLADGVLVIGTNAATKHLSRFLDCTKEYRAIGLLGCSTDSYDSQGKVVNKTSFAGITREQIEGVLECFRGEIEQTPPIFSALKMDGKPLYEYARTNTPLPRPIAPRKCTVSQLTLVDFKAGGEHEYQYPQEELGGSEKEELERIERMVKAGGVVVPAVDGKTESNGVETQVEGEEGSIMHVAETEVAKKVTPLESTTSSPTPREPLVSLPIITPQYLAFSPLHIKALPPIFEITMTVSSGTYVRSIIHDIGLALSSTAHVVKLTRTRQGEFPLSPVEVGEGAGVDTWSGGCVEWSTLERAMEELKEGRGREGEGEDGWVEWERELLKRCKEV